MNRMTIEKCQIWKETLDDNSHKIYKQLIKTTTNAWNFSWRVITVNTCSSQLDLFHPINCVII